MGPLCARHGAVLAGRLARAGRSAAAAARAGACAAFVAVVTGACAAPPDEAVEPVALGDFSAVAQRAHCEWAVRCRHIRDEDTCDRLADPKLYDSRRSEDAIRAGRLGYDALAAGRCFHATAAASCAATPFSDPACDRMFIGELGEGQACTSSAECERGAACEDAACGAQCCLGTCSAPPREEEGPADDEPDPAEIGESCETHFDCVREAYCETDSRCTPLPEEAGERCLFGCLPGDLYCDTSVLECRQYADFGEACDPEGETDPRCNRAWAVCRGGACEPRPGEGDICAGDEESCIATTRCLFGRCVARGEAGDACEADDDCAWRCDDDAGACVDHEPCPADVGASPP